MIMYIVIYCTSKRPTKQGRPNSKSKLKRLGQKSTGKERNPHKKTHSCNWG